MFWLGFIVGLFIGANLAVVVAGILLGSKSSNAVCVSSCADLSDKIEIVQPGKCNRIV